MNFLRRSFRMNSSRSAPEAPVRPEDSNEVSEQTIELEEVIEVQEREPEVTVALESSRAAPGVVISGPNYSGPAVLTHETNPSNKSITQTKIDNILYSLEAQNVKDPIQRLKIQIRDLSSALIDGELDDFEHEKAKRAALLEARKQQVANKKSAGVALTSSMNDLLSSEAANIARPKPAVVVAQPLAQQAPRNETDEILVVIDDSDLTQDQEQERIDEERRMAELMQEFGALETPAEAPAEVPAPTIIEPKVHVPEIKEPVKKKKSSLRVPEVTAPVVVSEVEKPMVAEVESKVVSNGENDSPELELVVTIDEVEEESKPQFVSSSMVFDFGADVSETVKSTMPEDDMMRELMADFTETPVAVAPKAPQAPVVARIEPDPVKVVAKNKFLPKVASFSLISQANEDTVDEGKSEEEMLMELTGETPAPVPKKLPAVVRKNKIERKGKSTSAVVSAGDGELSEEMRLLQMLGRDDMLLPPSSNTQEINPSLALVEEEEHEEVASSKPVFFSGKPTVKPVAKLESNQPIRYGVIHGLLDKMDREGKTNQQKITSMSDLLSLGTITPDEFLFARDVCSR